MSRPPTIWKRKGRGYWTRMHGKQIPLGRDYAEAKAKFRALMLSNRPIMPGQFSVAELVGFFLAECQERVADKELSPDILANYRSFLLRWSEACRRVPPEQLRVYHLDAWVKSHKRDWNASTISTAIRRVKRWAKWCRAKGYLDVDYLRDATAPAQLSRNAADPADLLAMENAIRDTAFLEFYQVLYETGCRPGEIRAITAENIDPARSTAIVIGKTGPRPIGLSPRAVAILRRLSLVYPSGPLLRTPRGALWNQSNIKRHWRKWLKVAHTSGHIIPYHCRHDLHRRWSAAGISDLTIARQLGHTSRGLPHLGLLASTYAHVGAEPLAQAALAAEQAGSSPSTRQRPRGRNTIGRAR